MSYMYYYQMPMPISIQDCKGGYGYVQGLHTRTVLIINQ